MKRSNYLVLGPALICAGLFLCSCSAKEKKIIVTGSVTWKGEIPDHGDIILHPEDGLSMPDPGKIVNGRFKVETTAGKKRVQVSWSREKAVPAGVMGQGEREQLISKDYHTHESKLSIEVIPGQKNEFDFQLPLAE